MEGGPRQACTVADHHPSLEVNFIHVSHGNNGNEKAVGVVLFQLGGPDSLEAVEPFLFNLFSDPDIIDFPFVRLARPVLARLVASRRGRKVQEHYARIGGKSPIRELTERQATALQRELRKRLDARVFVAMRYWRPLTEEAIQAVEAHTFRQLFLLPLYPQYSKTTTGSSLNEWHRQYATARNPTPTKTIWEFYDHPLYLEAVVEKMNQGLEKFLPLPSSPGLSDVHLVFSAHGLPISVIEAGDPYRTQVEATAKLVMECGGWSNPHEVCYQSRVSPGRWLEPSLRATLHTIAARSSQRVLVIPISFVTDHAETLYEIDIEAREEARHAGIRQFELVPALNDSPKFIQALAELVRREVGAQSPPSLVEVTSLRTAL